jgi:hypothetical protein
MPCVGGLHHRYHWQTAARKLTRPSRYSFAVSLSMESKIQNIKSDLTAGNPPC